MTLRSRFVKVLDKDPLALFLGVSTTVLMLLVILMAVAVKTGC